MTHYVQKAYKANAYTKSEVHVAISAKANQSTTSTKSEVDNALANKLSKLTQSTHMNMRTTTTTTTMRVVMLMMLTHDCDLTMVLKMHMLPYC